jgi:hypothetical protein
VDSKDLHDGDFYNGVCKAVFGFLTGIVSPRSCEKIAEGAAEIIYHAILDDFIPNIRLVDIAYETNQARITDGFIFIPSAYINPQDMIQLLRQCLFLNLDSRIIQIFDKLKLLAMDEREQPVIAFGSFFLRFAKDLDDISTGETPLAQKVREIASQFVEYILDAYVSRCVGPKPIPPKDWQRKQCGCGCIDCVKLDAFLVGPTQEECRIVVKAQDRVQGCVHIKDQLPQIYQSKYKDTQPEYQTEMMSTASGLELLIRKTDSAWLSATETWKENKAAAETNFGYIFADENIRESLKKRLEMLNVS